MWRSGIIALAIGILAGAAACADEGSWTIQSGPAAQAVAQCRQTLTDAHSAGAAKLTEARNVLAVKVASAQATLLEEMAAAIQAADEAQEFVLAGRIREARLALENGRDFSVEEIQPAKSAYDQRVREAREALRATALAARSDYKASMTAAVETLTASLAAAKSVAIKAGRNDEASALQSLLDRLAEGDAPVPAAQIGMLPITDQTRRAIDRYDRVEHQLRRRVAEQRRGLIGDLVDRLAPIAEAAAGERNADEISRIDHMRQAIKRDLVGYYRSYTPAEVLEEFGVFPSWTVSKDGATGLVGHIDDPRSLIWYRGRAAGVNFEFGFKIKARWYHAIVAHIDGAEWSYCHGSKGNSAGVVVERGRRRLRAGATVTNPDTWHSMRITLQSSKVTITYDDEVVASGWVAPTQTPRPLKVAFASHQTQAWVKDVYLIARYVDSGPWGMGREGGQASEAPGDWWSSKNTSVERAVATYRKRIDAARQTAAGSLAEADQAYVAAVQAARDAIVAEIEASITEAQSKEKDDQVAELRAAKQAVIAAKGDQVAGPANVKDTWSAAMAEVRTTHTAATRAARRIYKTTWAGARVALIAELSEASLAAVADGKLEEAKQIDLAIASVANERATGLLPSPSGNMPAEEEYLPLTDQIQLALLRFSETEREQRKGVKKERDEAKSGVVGKLEALSELAGAEGRPAAVAMLRGISHSIHRRVIGNYRGLSASEVLTEFSVPNAWTVNQDAATGIAGHVDGERIWMQESVEVTELDYGFWIKANAYHVIYATVDGKRFLYSRGHWNNTGAVVWLGGERERRRGRETVTNPSGWHRMRLTVRDEEVSIFYDGQLVGREYIGPADDGKRTVRLGFMGHEMRMWIKGLYITSR